MPEIAHELEINELIVKFKSQVIDEDIETRQIVRRSLIYGDPFYYKNTLDTYHSLKEDVANHFKTHPHNVILIGSAKLGFSIAPKKLWKKFDSESDVDIVIVSEEAFKSFWKRIFTFNTNIPRTERDEKLYRRFTDYFFRGWIRPDLFYPSPEKNEWTDYFSELSRRYGLSRKISGALYHNFDFFENYHNDNLIHLRLNLKTPLQNDQQNG